MNTPETTEQPTPAVASSALLGRCVEAGADELDTAEVVAFDGQARTITLRFDLMPCAAIGEKWLVRPNKDYVEGNSG